MVLWYIYNYVVDLGWLGWVGFNYLFSGIGETKYYTPHIIVILLSYGSSLIYYYFGRH